MMKVKKLPKGIRKYIRQEKARIRREISDLSEQKKQIEETYKKLGINRAAEVKSIVKKKIK